MIWVLAVYLLLMSAVAAVYIAVSMLVIPQYGLNDLSELRDVGRAVLVGAALVAGLFARTLHEALQEHTGDTVNIVRVAKRSLRTTSFWRAMVVSPIVLFALLPHIEASQSNLLVTLLAFENGFFWRTVFERRIEGARAGVAGANPPPPAAPGGA